MILDKNGFSALHLGKYGYMPVNRHDVYIGRSIALYGEWNGEKNDLFFDICGEGDAVVEVGANIGSHTVPLSRCVGKTGRIYAYEPQRVVYQNLCTNLSLNSLANVEAHWLAVSDEAGRVHMPNVSYDAPNNFGALQVQTNGQGEPVEQVTLDEHLNIKRLKLLKADVEGMEPQVLRGANALIQKCRPYMYLRNDPESANRSALIAAVQAMRYWVYWHVAPLYRSDNYLRNAENVFDTTASYNILCVPEELSFAHIGKYRLKLIKSPHQGP